ncbi:hypothetical protein PV797_11295 [Clostridiaceae bacterium M8S5]|nr:hypothetical protein PV797_11295 [Clostridiaceae bacterium M8S5]
MKIYTVPQIITISNDDVYSIASMGSAVVEGVAGGVIGGVVGAIVVDMFPGPVIPG